MQSWFFTVRNVVAARLCFHRRLWFCSRGEGVYPSMHWAGEGCLPPAKCIPVHAGIHAPSPAATAADGTHPNGMHSCWYLSLNCYLRIALWAIHLKIEKCYGFMEGKSSSGVGAPQILWNSFGIEAILCFFFTLCPPFTRSFKFET